MDAPLFFLYKQLRMIIICNIKYRVNRTKCQFIFNFIIAFIVNKAFFKQKKTIKTLVVVKF